MIKAILAFFATICSPALAGDLAVIGSQAGNTVSIIDLDDFQIRAQTRLEGLPSAVAYDRQNRRAYVVSGEAGRLSVIDEDAQILAARDMGAGSFGVAAAQNGGFFLTDRTGGNLMRLDSGLTVLWRARTGKSPTGVAVSEDGQFVATADHEDHGVSVFDSSSGRLLRRIRTTGDVPFSLTFHGGRLWATDRDCGCISVMDPVSGRLLGTIQTSGQPSGVAFAQGRGFVTDPQTGTLGVFDPDSLELLGEIDVGKQPYGISALPDDSGVVVANRDSDTISVIDASGLDLLAEIKVPAGPLAFGTFTGQKLVH
ncbi:YncE family protein [Paracoccus sp. (in: a-proteobacteria)]|uniref:YncE family protein n=1 Tax=Paracoccus sp. TaxID=267 RepID=UPI003A8422BA